MAFRLSALMILAVSLVACGSDMPTAPVAATPPTTVTPPPPTTDPTPFPEPPTAVLNYPGVQPPQTLVRILGYPGCGACAGLHTDGHCRDAVLVTCSCLAGIEIELHTTTAGGACTVTLDLRDPYNGLAGRTDTTFPVREP